jgi:hypothetical protein
MLGLDALLGIGGKLIDKLIPDPEAESQGTTGTCEDGAGR